MELLLDTCTLLWTLFDDKKLSQEVKEMINNPDNEIFISSASLWEIAIKNYSHPNLMPFSPLEVFNVLIEQTDFHVLDIHYDAVFSLKNIAEQNIHRDPFDHMILSVAKEEQFSLITCDKNIAKYQDVKIIKY